MANKRTLRRGGKTTQNKRSKSVSEKQELSQIEKLLGEDFETLAEARRALKRETKPTSKPKQKPRSKPKEKFNAKTASRKDKQKYAQKIGKAAYHKRVIEWWENHPDAEPDENPYAYHTKE